MDPSRKSVSIIDPQSWNRYTYSLNKPLTHVDQNGKWPTKIHDLIVDRALARLSAAQRQEIKKGSWSVDDPLKGGQNTSRSNEHGMTIPGQSQDEAAVSADTFINNNVDAAKYNYAHHGLTSSLYDFGRAFHTVSDMTSPAHEGYQAWHVSDTRSHIKSESSINHFRMGLAVASLLFVVVLLYPFQSTVVTPKSVLVVTEDWKPIEGARVRQTWQHYSLESEGHEQELRTNERGRAMFPRRTIRASVLRRIVHPMWNILRQGVHASFGVHADILDLNEGIERQDLAGIEPEGGEIIFRRR